MLKRNGRDLSMVQAYQDFGSGRDDGYSDGHNWSTIHDFLKILSLMITGGDGIKRRWFYRWYKQKKDLIMRGFSRPSR